MNNLGLDIGLLKRIDLNIDVYDKQARSLLMLKPLPLTSGYSNIMQNIGSIR